MTHIHLNHVFLMFGSIFGEIYWKLLFLVKNMTISERSSEKLRKCVFLNKFEKGQIQRKIWICCKQPFLFKAVKRDNINKNWFSPQNEPHIAKLCFSVVLKYFWANSPKILCLVQKNYYLRKKHRNTHKFYFF